MQNVETSPVHEQFSCPTYLTDFIAPISIKRPHVTADTGHLPGFRFGARPFAAAEKPAISRRVFRRRNPRRMECKLLTTR